MAEGDQSEGYAPRGPKRPAVAREALLWMEAFGGTTRLLSGVPNQKVSHLAARARALDASELRKVGKGRRQAMLVCLIPWAKVS